MKRFMMASESSVPEPPARTNHPVVRKVGLPVVLLLGSLWLHLAVLKPFASKSKLLGQRVAVVPPMFHTERAPGTQGNNTTLPLGRLSNSQLPPEIPSNRSQDEPGSLLNNTQLPRRSTPSKRLISISRFKGRLGNQMFAYAALKGLAHLTNRTPVLTVWPKHIRETFQKLQVTALKRGEVRGWHSILENRFNTTASIATVVNSKHSNMALSGYYQCPLYFDTALPEIRNEFVFREKYTERAEDLLRNITPKARNNGSFVTVAIHLRRGDLATWSEKGIIFPPKSFFRNAIDFFRKRYKHVLFVIGSDKRQGCAAFFKDFDGTFVFLPEQPYYYDMATLTKCDHAIITIGTFSWWVGWLVKGTTVYYKGHVRKNSLFGRIWKGNEYIPIRDEYNNWVALI